MFQKKRNFTMNKTGKGGCLTFFSICITLWRSQAIHTKGRDFPVGNSSQGIGVGTIWLYSDRALLISNSQFSCLSAPLLGLYVFNNSQAGSKSFWKYTCLIVFGCVSLPEMVLTYSHCCSVLPSTALVSF